MVDKTFFEETREQSEVKARIVSKYFVGWAWVITHTQRHGRVQYIDLFAGPGRYADGTLSTPVLVLKGALEEVPGISTKLVSVFNDRDPDNVERLKAAIREIPGIDTLKFPPRILREEVDEEVYKAFEDAALVPTFSFVDPWGYKGLSLRLIHSIIKDWGCDCAFFFNYNRINMGLNNPAFTRHIDALFGEERAAKLREGVEGLTPAVREELILSELEAAIRALGGEFVLPFRFRAEGGRVSHHLVFVSKNRLGYDIMKRIMAKECPCSPEGVPSFEFSEEASQRPPLFHETTPLKVLEDSLLERFAGKTLKMKDLFDAHNVSTNFIAPNYKSVLCSLEKRGIISAEPAKRRAGTFGDNVVAIFPKRR